MRVFKKLMAVVAAWTLGAACFAFFLTTLDKPTPPRVVETAAPTPPPRVTSAPLSEPSTPLIVLDPILIVGHVAPRVAASAVAGDTWDCDAWRPLVQGDVAQQVKLCRTGSDAPSR